MAIVRRPDWMPASAGMTNYGLNLVYGIRNEALLAIARMGQEESSSPGGTIVLRLLSRALDFIWTCRGLSAQALRIVVVA